MDGLKFKPGDRVRRVRGRHSGMKIGDEDEVIWWRWFDPPAPAWTLKKFGAGHDGDNLELVPRASPATGEPVYAGHHSDGSSIQNHSAGPLYPYVLIWRDKKGGPNANGKYDVGVMGPRITGTMWCPSLDDAVKIAEIIKEMK